MIVVNAAPVSVLAIKFVAYGEMLGARDSVPVIQIEHCVKDGIVVRNFHDGTIRKSLLDALLEYLPFHGSVEIVGHEETAAQQIIAQLFHLCVRRSPFAYLDGIKERPVVYLVFIVQIYALLDGARVNASQAPHGLGERPVGGRIILGPEGKPFSPTPVKPAPIAG